MFTYPIGLYNPGGGFDPDAQAFIDAAVITDSTQQEAINTLTVGLKADSLWNKMNAIYPIVGGTAIQHKYNLKDPRDLDAAFRLFFEGTLIHSSTGILPDGATGRAYTYLVPSVALPTDSMSISYYSRTNTNSGVCIDIGVIDVLNNIVYLSAQYDGGGGSGLVNVFLGRNSSVSILADTANLDARGLYDCTKISNGVGTFKLHKNGIVSDTQTGAGINPALQISLFCSTVSGGYNFYSNRECAFAHIGEGLTDTDSANLYTLVQAYQTTLGRQV